MAVIMPISGVKSNWLDCGYFRSAAVLATLAELHIMPGDQIYAEELPVRFRWLKGARSDPGFLHYLRRTLIVPSLSRIRNSTSLMSLPPLARTADRTS